ncbi:MAG: hypothetical protein OQK12_07345 [Motiliproteus sp.]|nr:hypothetical protein [Motiliproteus sp.]MCW9052703.1 hypothetical protein [Motiliproteus sp.]
MLTYEDCLEMCELTPEEIEAIAEHEHLQRIQAIAKADYLVHTEGGERMIRKMIIDDIRHAQERGDAEHEADLKQVLALFIKTHPRHNPVNLH